MIADEKKAHRQHGSEFFFGACVANNLKQKLITLCRANNLVSDAMLDFRAQQPMVTVIHLPALDLRMGFPNWTLGSLSLPLFANFERLEREEGILGKKSKNLQPTIIVVGVQLLGLGGVDICLV